VAYLEVLKMIDFFGTPPTAPSKTWSSSTLSLDAKDSRLFPRASAPARISVDTISSKGFVAYLEELKMIDFKKLSLALIISFNANADFFGDVGDFFEENATVYHLELHLQRPLILGLLQH
jgi:hypothetical protein